MNSLLQPIEQFLFCRTPDSWVEAAMANRSLLLIDHAHCEKKAASAALNLIYHYSQHYDLIQKMSRIVREEMRHFEQVRELIHKRNIEFMPLTPGRYAKGLHKHIRNGYNDRLVDLLIVGALVEARSCERFAVVAEKLDDELAQFYYDLLKSEARHFEIYLNFARKFSPDPIDDRIQLFGTVEKELVLSEDTVFRFHSGAFRAER